MLAGFGEAYGINPDIAFRLGRGFGAGMGLGNTCGALTGAFMILGLEVQDAKDEKEARTKTYDRVREFVRRFEAIHSTGRCSQLLGVDMATEAGRKEALERKLFKTVCPVFVHDAAVILAEML
ncbi:MAG: C-GCAxxG-C-C family protein [Thermodesulfobacteriota bacterium]